MLAAFLDFWTPDDLVVIAILIVTAFCILYALALVHRKIRYLEAMIAEMQKDQSVMSDELEIVAATGKEEARLPSKGPKIPKK
ncbi:MAG: hypothetical protein V1798_01300 [Pseudomonadota bacterium]